MQRQAKQQRIKLDKKLSQHKTKEGDLMGTGMTAGSLTPSVTGDGDHVIGGKFTVLWYERRFNKSQKKMIKYLKRKTIKLVSNRDMQEQIISGISLIAGQTGNG